MNPSHSSSSFDDKALQEAKALDRAIKEGIKLTRLPDNNYLASSSVPGNPPYLVRTYPFTCTCTGFSRWYMCKHTALAIATELANKKAVRCPHCNTVYKLPITDDSTMVHLLSYGVSFVDDEEPTL